MSEQVRKLKGANMDIDLATPTGDIAWEQERCPWNEAENTDSHRSDAHRFDAHRFDAHRCAVKNVSLCRYFRGVEYLDTLLCSYPNEN